MRKILFAAVAVAGLALAATATSNAMPASGSAIANGASELGDIVLVRRHKSCSAWRYRGSWRGVRHYRRYCRYY
jgi:hypothetical protein